MLRSLIEKLIGAGPQKESAVRKKQPRDIGALRMIVIADLHACYYKDAMAIRTILKTEEYDCVLFLGDIHAGDIKSFVPCAGGRPCLYVLGNHDEWHQNRGIDGLTDLDRKVVKIRGVRIGGASGAPRYKQNPDFAMRTEEEIGKVLDGLGEVDILVTHESPYHLMSQNTAHGGYMAITDYLAKNDVPLHIFGHHHENYEEVIEGTREVCVYGCAMVQTMPFGMMTLHT